jgi:predicted O-methyltransferase YrrM
METLHHIPDLMARRYFEVINRLLMSEERRAIETRDLGLFVPPGHYYSPLVDLDQLHRSPPAQVETADDALPMIRIDGARMHAFWQSCLPLLRECPFPASKTEGFRYCYENPSYSYGDAMMLYTMLRKHQPRRVVEVGSGHSSACLLDTVERYLGETSVTFVDPYPDYLRTLLTDGGASRTRVVAKPIQEVGLELYDTLGENDILFIDSTHVAKTGGDVCHEFFNILPFLNAGVLIHFHDMFYPFEYPHPWIYDENRSWNEIYLMRAFLMNNDAFEIVFFNDFFWRFYRDEIMATYPQFANNPGGALWLRKVSPALKRKH